MQAISGEFFCKASVRVLVSWSLRQGRWFSRACLLTKPPQPTIQDLNAKFCRSGVEKCGFLGFLVIELLEGGRVSLWPQHLQAGQGQLGDCYFLSAVAATGSTNMEESWSWG